MQAKLIKMVLTRHNFDVEIACNGLMALDMYRTNSSYEIIVMVCYLCQETLIWDAVR